MKLKKRFKKIAGFISCNDAIVCCTYFIFAILFNL